MKVQLHYFCMKILHFHITTFIFLTVANFGLQVLGENCNLTSETRNCGFDYCFALQIARSVEITSPNYPKKYSNNTDCSWNLKAPFGERIKIIFQPTSPKLSESSEECSDNYLLIKDLTGVHRFCGSDSGAYLSTAPQIRVQFIGNSFGNFEEFKLTATTQVVKHFQHFEMPKGILTLPKVTDSYPKEIFSTWMIEAPDKHHIALSCNNTLKLQDKINCDKSGLYIGDEPAMINAKGYCSHFPKVINSKRNKLFLIFHSNEDHNENFKCFYDFFTDVKQRHARSPSRKSVCECNVAEKRFFSESEVKVEEEVDKKVSGGVSALNDDVPWIVGIAENGRVVCGGSLIAKNVVLTAAHCLSWLWDPTELKVVIGKYNPWDQEKNEYYSVKSAKQHPNFNEKRGFDYDVALLFIEPPSYITAKHIICLPPEDDGIKPGIMVRLLGWGRTGPAREQLFVTLQKLDIPIEPLDNCRYRWQGITTNMICVSAAYGRNACQGDSGGPIVRAISNTLRILGIVSFGDEMCYAATRPSIYGRVSKYLPWILKNANMKCIPPN